MKNLFCFQLMINKRISPIKRQKIISIFMEFLLLLIVMFFSCWLKNTSSLYPNEIFIIKQLIFVNGSILPFILFFSEKYEIQDDYPYLMAKSFRNNEKIPLEILMELSDCGVNVYRSNGKWIVIKHFKY